MVKRKAKAKDRNRPLRGGPAAVAGRLLRLFLLGGALFLFFHLTAGEPTLRIGFAALLTSLALHEGGHLFMMLCSGALGRKARCGARAYPWGVELRTARGYRSYGEQVLVSLGGVGVNFLTAALLFAGTRRDACRGRRSFAFFNGACRIQSAFGLPSSVAGGRS